MTIDVLIESVPAGVRASTGAPWNLTAEAASESQAIQDLKDQYQTKVSAGARLVTLSLDAARIRRAWDVLAGMPEEDWEKFQDAVREYRESCDAADAAG